MPALPPRADLDHLRRHAKERLRAARSADADALAWIGEVDAGLTLAASQLRIARDYGFDSWPALVLEVCRRRVLDVRDPEALAHFVAEHPSAATRDLSGWSDHPKGASPLGYLAMARFDTARQVWRDAPGTAPIAHALIAAGAPVDGNPGDPETPLITAASYGDADVAAVLIAAGASVEARSAPGSGGVPNATALTHAAVFGMTEVLDLLVAAGARVTSIEEAAAAGDLSGWLTEDVSAQATIRALVMAADHERVAVIARLVAAGTPVDEADEVFGRHPLRLAAANGRPASVRALLAHGADPDRRDARGFTALDHCRRRLYGDLAPSAYDEIEALLDL